MSERNPRETSSPLFTLKLSLQVLLAMVVIAGGVGASIWGMSAAFGEKATHAEVRKLEDKHDLDFRALERVMWEMRREQRIIVDKVAPEKARFLEPLPREPGE